MLDLKQFLVDNGDIVQWQEGGRKKKYWKFLKMTIKYVHCGGPKKRPDSSNINYRYLAKVKTVFSRVWVWVS